MQNLQQLRESREVAGKAILRMRHATAGRAMLAEEEGAWRSMNADYDRLNAQIEAIEGDSHQNRTDGPVPGMEDTTPRSERRAERRAGPSVMDEAVFAWTRAAAGKPVSDRHRRAAERAGVSLTSGEIYIPLGGRAELRAQSVGSDTAGGYLQPTNLRDALERALKMYGGPRAVADIVRTDNGGDFVWPAVDDTGNVAELLAENVAAAEQDITLTALTLGAYKYSSKVVRVSNELMEDSVIDLGAELGMLLGERIARQQGAAFTTGTGVSQPQGVVTGAALGKTAASATAITADECLDLFHSLDPAYRDDPSCAFAANDSTWLYLRKLKDTQNRYLWGPGLDGMQSDRFLGKPALTFPSMASMATGAKTMLFGAFRYYKVRDVRGVRLVRLNERYAIEDQTAFVAFLRSDGKLLNPGASAATAPMKHLIQA